MIAALAADLTSAAAPLVRTCVVAGDDALLLGPLGINLALTLGLLLLNDEGVPTGPPVADDGSGFFTTADHVEVLGRLGLVDDPAPDCKCGEGEPAADPLAPPSPTARCARGCDRLPKFLTRDNPGLRWENAFPGTSQERSISSRSLALFLFACFAQLLPFSRLRSKASTSLSAPVSWTSTISLRSSSGARGYSHRDRPSWKGTRAWGAGEVPIQ